MKYLVRENPEAIETLELIEDAFSKRAFLILISCCRVKYEGRAVSRLGLGDRALIIKADGSFLIHQNRNLEPVNWQPPKTKFKTMIKDDIVYIKGVRRYPNESLEVEIHKTYLVSFFIGEDTKSLELAGYEEDMADMIFKNPDLIEEGFRPTSREYSTSQGFIDIIGKDKNGNITVLELKSRHAGVNAVKQLKRYLEDFEDHKKFVRGILVAPSITEDARELLEENKMEFVSLEPPNELKREGNVTLDFYR